MRFSYKENPDSLIVWSKASSGTNTTRRTTILKTHRRK